MCQSTLQVILYALGIAAVGVTSYFAPVLFPNVGTMMAFSGMQSGMINLGTQYYIHRDFGKIDLLGFAGATAMGFFTLNPLLGSTVVGGFDAMFDYSTKGGFASPFYGNKSLTDTAIDFGFGFGGNYSSGLLGGGFTPFSFKSIV